MSTDTDEKVVQTRLSAAEYERFRRIADEEGVTLKEALRRAVSEYTGSRDSHDPEDPFFAGTDDENGGGSSDGDLTATETEAYLYGDE